LGLLWELSRELSSLSISSFFYILFLLFLIFDFVCNPVYFCPPVTPLHFVPTQVPLYKSTVKKFMLTLILC
jgi:hypothetical protein